MNVDMAYRPEAEVAVSISTASIVPGSRQVSTERPQSGWMDRDAALHRRLRTTFTRRRIDVYQA